MVNERDDVTMGRCADADEVGYHLRTGRFPAQSWQLMDRADRQVRALPYDLLKDNLKLVADSKSARSIQECAPNLFGI